MKLDSIKMMWNEDSKINKSQLDQEACDISRLHHKYYEIYLDERALSIKLEADLRRLRHEKKLFFVDGGTPEDWERGWKLPPKGKVLRTDAQDYVETDRDVESLAIRAALQRDKVDYLESIVKMIMNRNYALRTALDFQKFSAGF
jgi:hypothetical protein